MPTLKKEIETGLITLSNARKIAPVLTVENQVEWLGKARELSFRRLDQEVAKIRPQTLTPERATYVTETRVKLELGLSEKEMMRLRRVQDLLSQKKKTSVTLESALSEMMTDFLHRYDPVERAQRFSVKSRLAISEGMGQSPEEQSRNRQGQGQAQDEPNQSSTGLRGIPVALNKRSIIKEQCLWESTRKTSTPLPLTGLPKQKWNGRFRAKHSPISSAKRARILADLLHQVNLRDQRRCTYWNAKGGRCNQARWVEIHHRRPISEGGGNALENLVTLYSSHHRWIHRSDQ